MIPTISDILAGLLAGTYTADQAQALIQQHIDLAVAQATDRNTFAAAALQGQLATGVRKPTKEALADECFKFADAMVAASGATS